MIPFSMMATDTLMNFLLGLTTPQPDRLFNPPRHRDEVNQKATLNAPPF